MGRRAVIVGAGIGGLTTAVALVRAGWDVVVLERAARLEPVGAGISLWPNALRAFDVIGVRDALREAVAVSGGSGVRRPDGRWVARSDVGAAVRARFGEPLVVVHRAELVDILVGALPAGALRTGTAAESVETAGDRAAARTATGDVEGDVVVAADGIRSATRARLFPAHPGPVYAGYTAWRTVVPALWRDVTPFETWGDGGRRFAVIPMSGERWYCYATASVAAGERAADEARELALRFGDWHRPVPDVIAATEHARVLRQDVEELREPLPAMHAGRVALLGDAAHAMTPDLGQGGGMAIEDAVQLALLLGRLPVEDALAAYTRLRLPRTTDVARRSRRTGRLYSAPYRAQLLAARVMGVVPGSLVARGLDPLLRWEPAR